LSISIRNLIASLLQRFKNRSFLADVAFLAGGAAFSQALSVVTSPVLTRLFSPRDYGILAVFSSVLAVLAIVSGGRYEVTIPLPRSDGDAINLLGLCLFVNTLATLGTAALVLVFGSRFAQWTNVPALAGYLWMLPVSVFGSGLYQTLYYWTLRKKNFSAINRTRISQSIGQIAIQIPGGLLHLGATSLLVGTIASQVLGTGSLLKLAHLRLNDFQPRKWFHFAKEYRAFPLINSWDALINVLGARIPHLMFAVFASVELAGFYSLTLRVLGLPAILVGQAVSQVFYPSIAQMKEQSGESRRFIEGTATALLLVSFPVFTIVALHGPFLFAWVFGNSWKASGRFAQYLSPFFIISFVSSPLSTYALVRRKQQEAFFYGLATIVFRSAALWIGLRCGSADLAVGLYSASGALMYLLYLRFVLRLAGSGLQQWLFQIKPLILGGPSLVAVLLVMTTLVPKMASLFLSIVALSLFCAWFWRSGYARPVSANANA
jgi:O-antigen/teichoic acid export membrane protein